MKYFLRSSVVFILYCSLLSSQGMSGTWAPGSALNYIEELDERREVLQVASMNAEALSHDINTVLATGGNFGLAFDRPASLEERETSYKAIIRNTRIFGDNSLKCYQPLRQVVDARYWGHLAAIFVINAAAHTLNKLDQKADDIDWQQVRDPLFKKQIREHLSGVTTVFYTEYYSKQASYREALAQRLAVYDRNGSAIEQLLSPMFTFWHGSVVRMNSARDITPLGHQRRRRAEFIQLMRHDNTSMARAFLESMEKHDLWANQRLTLLKDAQTVSDTEKTCKTNNPQSVHALDNLTKNILPRALDYGKLVGYASQSLLTFAAMQKNAEEFMDLLIEDSQAVVDSLGDDLKADDAMLQRQQKNEQADLKGSMTVKANVSTVFATYAKTHLPTISKPIADNYQLLFSRTFQAASGQHTLEELHTFMAHRRKQFGFQIPYSADIAIGNLRRLMNSLHENIELKGGCLPGIINRMLKEHLTLLGNGMDEMFLAAPCA